jgi:hypothetical protein
LPQLPGGDSGYGPAPSGQKELNSQEKTKLVEKKWENNKRKIMLRKIETK